MTQTPETQTSPAHQRIQQEVDREDVVLFMKGTPDFPQCGFSSQISQLLTFLGVPFNSVNVLEDEDIRQGIKAYSDWPTIPQLYIKGEFIGGCDIVRDLYETGELQTLLVEKNIATHNA
ncbi:MAG: Grx4 family monothiol glutaredoxin [Parvularculales bacterium]